MTEVSTVRMGRHCTPVQDNASWSEYRSVSVYGNVLELKAVFF